MGSLYSNRQYRLVLAVLFFTLLLFNVFTVTKLPIRDAAFMTMEWTQYATIFLLGYLMQKKSFFLLSFKPFYLGIGLFAGVYIVLHFLSGRLDVSSDLTHVLLVIIFVFALAHIKWEDKHITLFAIISVGLLLLFLIQWMSAGFPTFQFQSYTRNSNIFGVFVAVLVYFPVAAFKNSPLRYRIYFSVGILVALLLVYASSTRGALLLLFVAFGARIILKFSRRAFFFLFHAVMLFNFLFLVVYSCLSKYPLFIALNDWYLETFGKQIFSGRQHIWEPGISYGFENPLFGHFIGILPEDYIPDTHYVHAHNQYLQIFLESGLVGFACF